MEFSELIKARFACKAFDAAPVERARLQAVLEAGRLAPTAKNGQIQRVYVIESAKGLAAVDAATPCRYGAPVVIAVAYDSTLAFTYPGGKYSSGAEDATIVATHMVLAAKNEGLDTCWVNFFDPDKLAAALGLPENHVIVMLMPIGRAAPGAAPLENHFSRKPLKETVACI